MVSQFHISVKTLYINSFTGSYIVRIWSVKTRTKRQNYAESQEGGTSTYAPLDRWDDQNNMKPLCPTRCLMICGEMTAAYCFHHLSESKSHLSPLSPNNYLSSISNGSPTLVMLLQGKTTAVPAKWDLSSYISHICKDTRGSKKSGASSETAYMRTGQFFWYPLNNKAR